MKDQTEPDGTPKATKAGVPDIVQMQRQIDELERQVKEMAEHAQVHGTNLAHPVEELAVTEAGDAAADVPEAGRKNLAEEIAHKAGEETLVEMIKKVVPVDRALNVAMGSVGLAVGKVIGLLALLGPPLAATAAYGPGILILVLPIECAVVAILFTLDAGLISVLLGAGAAAVALALLQALHVGKTLVLQTCTGEGFLRTCTPVTWHDGIMYLVALVQSTSHAYGPGAVVVGVLAGLIGPFVFGALWDGMGSTTTTSTSSAAASQH